MKTLKTSLLTFSIIANFSLLSQAPQTNWAWQIGSSNNDTFFALDVDNVGATYVGGYYSGDLDVNPNNTISEQITHNDDYKKFLIAKYDEDGALIWYKNDLTESCGGSEIQELAVTENRVFSIGQFGVDTCDADVIIDNQATLNSNGLIDVFILALDEMGNFINALPMGGFGDDVAGNLRTNSNGELIVCGVFAHSSSGSETIQIAPGLTVPNPSPNNFVIWIAKYDQDLNGIWAKTLGQTNQYFNDNFLPIDVSLEIDQNDNIVVAGNFVGQISLDPDNHENISQMDGRGMFLLKLNSSGEQIWGGIFGNTDISENSTGSEFLNDVSIDNQGNIFIGGRLTHLMNFNWIDEDVINAFSPGLADMYIAKYNSDGKCQWVKTSVGFAQEECVKLDTDNFGNIYACGFYNSLMGMDSQTLSHNDSNDAWWMCLGSNGSLGWISSISGEEMDNCNNIRVRSEASTATVYTTGGLNDRLVPNFFSSSEEYDNDHVNGFDGFLISQDVEMHIDPCSAGQYCLGDLNFDNVVSAADLLIFLSVFGSTCN